MRSKTTSWFETKVRYDKTMEDGQNKKVTEAYTVEALSFQKQRVLLQRRCRTISVANLT